MIGACEGRQRVVARLAHPRAQRLRTEAEESLAYWRSRQDALPLRKRTACRGAEEMVARWEQRLAAAKRARDGPTPVQQLLEALGLSWTPQRLRRTLLALGGLIAALALLLGAALLAIVLLWPELEPLVHTLLEHHPDSR